MRTGLRYELSPGGTEYDSLHAHDEEDEHPGFRVIARTAPPLRFVVGQRVRIAGGGLQEYKIRSVEFCGHDYGWMIHASFGPCKLYMWQQDLIGV